MLLVLRHMGFGTNMLQWISIIYSSPSARVRANGVLLKSQMECDRPAHYRHSSSLCHWNCFSVPLNPDITGIKIGDTHHKILAYANGMLFSLTNPLISLPNLMNTFERYGAFSNLQINFCKSEAMRVNLPHLTMDNLQSNFRLKWNNKGLTYFGTLILSDTTNIF